MQKSSKTPESKEQEARLREQIMLKEQIIKLREGLPFLHGWKWYKWAREFFECTNKMSFLCAANQISKSSTQIRKCIDWATNRGKWPELWNHKPSQFWYLYPTSSQATIEFREKWSQFLPKNEYADHPVYGWKKEIKNKEIFAIHFNSGVSIYFKTYSQDAQSLQTGSVDAIFCDEELPVEIYDELVFRVSATDGYFHMVFTATLGQAFWKQVMEPDENEKPLLPEASKWTVSMYDCQVYDDGTPSHWTEEKILERTNRCKSHNEVLKRIFGRFVVDADRKFEQFSLIEHMKDPHHVPKDWVVYAGVDIGSGGDRGHPSAIVFVAVRPDYRAGRVFLGWRGDGVLTTAGDVLEKYQELKRDFKISPVAQFYDWASKDFHTIATRSSEPFIPADKDHKRGEDFLNTLFKAKALLIYKTPELLKLGGELSYLRGDTPKNKAKDDFCDALRYAITRIPWDWEAIAALIKAPEPEIVVKLTPYQQEIADRRGAFGTPKQEYDEWYANEVAEANDLYES